MTPKEKIDALRQVMKQRKIDAWIAPSTDPHHSEHPASCWKSREWLSGFTGSAGTLVVTQEKAGLWTDFRYFIQAEQELKGSGIEVFKIKMPGVPDYRDWLLTQLHECSAVGFDGHVFSVEEVQELHETLQPKQIQLSYQQDLVAEIWQDRPGIPANSAFVYDVRFAGESRASKIARIRRIMREGGVNAHLISTLDEIAWIFNIRGSDIAYNPFVISYAYISLEEVCLFIKPEKLPNDVKTALESDGVICDDYDALVPFLQQLSVGTIMLIDPARTTQNFREAISSNCSIAVGENIALGLKAVKNETELQGIRDAHIRDGAAMVKWLHWLDQQIETALRTASCLTTNGKKAFTEVTIVESLEEFRKQGKHFYGLSFNPVVGYQANGAICHYAAKPEAALPIKPEGILLVDSGAQYYDGTTDITRTIALSEPTAQQKRDFTLVLKGHIALATARFPRGTKGIQLDTLARMALWRHGMDFGHGAGHGVGHFLSVHEGPQRIGSGTETPLEPGMFSSNEPGLYREGCYGIRIENLIITIAADETEFNQFYAFETVTLCPIDLALVDVALLTPEERTWLNRYHQAVYEKLSSLLSDAERRWLQHETRQV